MLEKIVTKESTSVDGSGRVTVVNANAILEDGVEIVRFYTTDIIDSDTDPKSDLNTKISDALIAVDAKISDVKSAAVSVDPIGKIDATPVQEVKITP